MFRVQYEFNLKEPLTHQFLNHPYPAGTRLFERTFPLQAHRLAVLIFYSKMCNVTATANARPMYMCHLRADLVADIVLY